MKFWLQLALVGALLLSVSSSVVAREKVPKGWTKLGAVEGLLSDDWYSKKTRTAVAWAREGDLSYLDPVVSTLDTSYETNARFMGYRATGPLKFYFFSMTEPAHLQPKWKSRIGRMTKFAGLALSGTDTCLVNLGSQQHATPSPPWELEATSCHEMNHLFAYQRVNAHGWSWFLEAIAENIEQSVLPAQSQMDVSDYRTYLKGYQSKDASWAALTAERNNNDVDSYRDFGPLLSSVISFLQTKYPGAVAKILKAAPGKSVDEALVAALGKNASQLEVEWKQFYGIR